MTLFIKDTIRDGGSTLYAADTVYTVDTVNFIQTAYHTSYLSRKPREFSSKFFLAGVNFYRFNAKNWQFTVHFAVITQKIGNLLCILS